MNEIHYASAVALPAQISDNINPPAIHKALLVLQEIFFNLDIPNLAKSCSVCKRWNEAINKDGSVWKRVIFNELAFTNAKWAKAFGAEVVAQENRDDEFETLPSTIVQEYRNFHRVCPKIKYKDGLMLVRIPKTLNGELTINSLCKLAKKLFFRKLNEGHISDEVITELGDKSIDESRWVLITTEALRGSVGVSYVKQVEMVAKLAEDGLIGCEVPEALVLFASILAKYSKIGRYYLGYIYCRENIHGEQMVVGVDSLGYYVATGTDAERVNGMAVQRNL